MYHYKIYNISHTVVKFPAPAEYNLNKKFRVGHLLERCVLPVADDGILFGIKRHRAALEWISEEEE